MDQIAGNPQKKNLPCLAVEAFIVSVCLELKWLLLSPAKGREWICGVAEEACRLQPPNFLQRIFLFLTGWMIF